MAFAEDQFAICSDHGIATPLVGQEAQDVELCAGASDLQCAQMIASGPTQIHCRTSCGIWCYREFGDVHVCTGPLRDLGADALAIACAIIVEQQSSSCGYQPTKERKGQAELKQADFLLAFCGLFLRLFRTTFAFFDLHCLGAIGTGHKLTFLMPSLFQSFHHLIQGVAFRLYLGILLIA